MGRINDMCWIKGRTHDKCLPRCWIKGRINDMCWIKGRTNDNCSPRCWTMGRTFPARRRQVADPLSFRTETVRPETGNMFYINVDLRKQTHTLKGKYLSIIIEYKLFVLYIVALLCLTYRYSSYMNTCLIGQIIPYFILFDFEKKTNDNCIIKVQVVFELTRVPGCQNNNVCLVILINGWYLYMTATTKTFIHDGTTRATLFRCKLYQTLA